MSFPGFKSKKERMEKLMAKSRVKGKERLEKLKENPEAFDAMKRMVMMQLLSAFGVKAYEWVSEKPGRRFVVDHEEDGISVVFTEGGEELIPEFMKQGG